MKIYLLALVMALALFANHPGKAQGATHSENKYKEFVEYFRNRKFNNETFKEALRMVGFPDKHIESIYIHARVESGNFGSRLFREQRNAFGMRLAKKRVTTATGKRRGYAVYDAWYDSVYDYWLWFKAKPIKKKQSWKSYLRARKYMNPRDGRVT